MVSRLRRIPQTSPSSYDTTNNDRKSPKRRFFFSSKHRKEEDRETPPPTETMQHTRVVPMVRVPVEPDPVTTTVVIPKPSTTLCHTSPLLFHLCGRRNPHDAIVVEEEDVSPEIPDDPTVEESIECVIAASQGELADLLKDIEEFPATPSYLQQSLMKNRSFERMPAKFQFEARHRSPQGSYRSVPYDTTPAVSPQAEEPTKESCDCCQTPQPVAPTLWPQRPLLLRPTPKSGTVIRGVRFATATEYLWTPESKHTWMEALQAEHRGELGCYQCATLPINSGDETTALVTDFESELFIGSLLLRVRGSQCMVDEASRKPHGYFYGLNRRYQVVIRGKFKQEIPWTECYSGFQLERPAGKLPPKWIVNGALNVIKFFAPQVQTNMHGGRPYSLTPLGSTPQVLALDSDANIEQMQEEPTQAEQTLLGQASTANSSMQRARQRKKNFDRIFAAEDKTSAKLMTDTSKEYTFEFLQHLFNFEDFSIELGSMLGSISLQGILAGQALQIMASHGQPNPLDGTSIQNRLWCFDIWHEMLLSHDGHSLQ